MGIGKEAEIAGEGADGSEVRTIFHLPFLISFGKGEPSSTNNDKWKMTNDKRKMPRPFLPFDCALD